MNSDGITRQQYNHIGRDRVPQHGANSLTGTPIRRAARLQGAGGTYRCDGATRTATCTVQNRGAFTFAGDWDFIPSSGTVRIVVPDAEYMWFGVWARQTVRLAAPNPDQPTELGVRGESRWDGNAVTTLADATGVGDLSRPRRRTVRGLRAGHGRFRHRQLHCLGNASSGLRCRPEHGLRDDHGVQQRSKLVPGPEAENITGGTVAAATDDVTWTIDGVPDDSGTWEAAFYANLPTR